jgi:hypothetical protein
MSGSSLARRAALVVAGAVGLFGVSSTAAAQRPTPRQAQGPTPTPPTPPATPYPGATVTIDQRFFGQQAFSRQDRRRERERTFFIPIPLYYPSGGYGGGVYDTNGRPLSSYLDGPATQAAPAGAYGPTGSAGPAGSPWPMGSATPQNDFPAATPDLSGSPYVVTDGGTMVVDFGNGDRRGVPSCAKVEEASTPDGQPRTLFYQPPAYALVLRAGQHGQVLGRPTAGARVCYTTDAYGRVVLAY